MASSGLRVFAKEVKGPLHLPMPQPPADVRLNDIGQAGSFRAVRRRIVRPGFYRLGDMVKAHRQMSGSGTALPQSRPLRTVREPLGSYGSSLSRVVRGTEDTAPATTC